MVVKLENEMGFCDVLRRIIDIEGSSLSIGDYQRLLCFKVLDLGFRHLKCPRFCKMCGIDAEFSVVD